MKKLSCLLLALLLTLTPLAGGIVLPTAADDTAPKITPAPHAYAQGLAAWYAGEQNTRAGQNPESTVWEDLIGGYDMTVRTQKPASPRKDWRWNPPSSTSRRRCAASSTEAPSRWKSASAPLPLSVMPTILS